jgi:hypothetical protein
LVIVRTVGVKVILAVKLGKTRDITVQCQPKHHAVLDSRLVDGRQRSRQPKRERVGVRIWRVRKVIRIDAREHFGTRGKLNVNFQTTNGFKARRHGVSLTCSARDQKMM